MNQQQRAQMVFGALVADAASLGVHWIYDPKRLTEIAGRQNGVTAFTPIDAANYENVPAYFAHAARKDGMSTQYGECLWTAVQSLNKGGFDLADQTAAFAAHFGPGGAYHGYIDRPTRGALANIAAEVAPSGIDDDQLPALTRLVALVAADQNDHAKSAMQITNVNDVAWHYTQVFQALLNDLLTGSKMADALDRAALGADVSIQSALQDALETSEVSSTDYGEITGRACHLPMAGPLIFHILKHANSFEDAIERNNRAGGDNAGRSLMIGAAMAAVHGVPIHWALKLQNGDQVLAACQALTS